MSSVQGELDFDPPAVPQIAVGSLGRHFLNERIGEVVTRWWPRVEANSGRCPTGLYDDLAVIVEDYAAVAVREALAGSGQYPVGTRKET